LRRIEFLKSRIPAFSRVRDPYSDCQNCHNRVIAKIENRTLDNFGNSGDFGNSGNLVYRAPSPRLEVGDSGFQKTMTAMTRDDGDLGD
jgi:hypothetical protein